MAPSKTSPAIIDKLYRESTRGLALAETRSRFDEIGIEAIGNPPQQFAEIIEAETPRWAKFINNLGLNLD
jgi:tripartite-type tricarboxylate transporter receptor subunit TctC